MLKKLEKNLKVLFIYIFYCSNICIIYWSIFELYSIDLIIFYFTSDEFLYILFITIILWKFTIYQMKKKNAPYTCQCNSTVNWIILDYASFKYKEIWSYKIVYSICKIFCLLKKGVIYISFLFLQSVSMSVMFDGNAMRWQQMVGRANFARA